MKENLNSSKYIVFSMTQRKIGMDYIFKILNTFLLEAISLGRVPVIGKFAVRSEHNKYISRNDLQFEDYLDISKATLRRIDDIEDIIMPHQQWIKEEDLDLSSYEPEKISHVNNEVISNEMNERYDVIVRKDPSVNYIRNYFQAKKQDYILDIPYSEKVNQLTDIVLNALGTSRENALAAQYYFLDKVGTMRSCFDEPTRARGSSISLRRAYYACMHAQTRKTEQRNKQPLTRFAASKKQIKELLSYAISKGSRLYIMSDVLSSQHFDFLKEDYQVYRYYDFPELNELVSSTEDHDVDNVMLYSVEKNIMKYATVKIFPPGEGSMMYHLNEVYDVSELKDSL